MVTTGGDVCKRVHMQKVRNPQLDSDELGPGPERACMCLQRDVCESPSAKLGNPKSGTNEKLEWQSPPVVLQPEVPRSLSGICGVKQSAGSARCNKVPLRVGMLHRKPYKFYCGCSTALYTSQADVQLAQAANVAQDRCSSFYQSSTKAFAQARLAQTKDDSEYVQAWLSVCAMMKESAEPFVYSPRSEKVSTSSRILSETESQGLITHGALMRWILPGDQPQSKRMEAGGCKAQFLLGLKACAKPPFRTIPLISPMTKRGTKARVGCGCSGLHAETSFTGILIHMPNRFHLTQARCMTVFTRWTMKLQRKIVSWKPIVDTLNSDAAFHCSPEHALVQTQEKALRKIEMLKRQTSQALHDLQSATSFLEPGV